MYNVRGANIFANWNKTCYIATVKKIDYDEYGNEIKICNEPKEYKFNIQPASGYLDVATYGEKVSKVYKTIIPYNTYNGKFHEGDIAYLEGAKPENENSNTYGINGNYIIDTVRPQNLVIAIYFKKIEK